MKQAGTVEEEISAVEAARRLRVGLDYLYSLLWTQVLTARKVGGKWRVSVKAVEKRLRAKEEAR